MLLVSNINNPFHTEYFRGDGLLKSLLVINARKKTKQPVQHGCLLSILKCALAGVQQSRAGGISLASTCPATAICKGDIAVWQSHSIRDRKIRYPHGNTQKPNRWAQASFKLINQKHRDSCVPKTLSLMFTQRNWASELQKHCLQCLACTLP